MSPAIIAIAVVGALAVVAMVVVMKLVNESEARVMDQRRAKWIAEGSIPEEEPRFNLGSGGGFG